MVEQCRDQEAQQRRVLMPASGSWEDLYATYDAFIFFRYAVLYMLSLCILYVYNSNAMGQKILKNTSPYHIKSL